LRASDAVIAASGTVTLQVALTQTPMIVIYKMSWMTYTLARLLIDLPSVSLVNIIAEKKIVPELIQDEATSEGIGREIKIILSDRVLRDKMKNDLGEVAARLGKGGASNKAAAAIVEMLLTRKQPPSL
jgi:lipid-A-disaccharide synthase